jgi:hypothetical protein
MSQMRVAATEGSQRTTALDQGIAIALFVKVVALRIFYAILLWARLAADRAHRGSLCVGCHLPKISSKVGMEGCPRIRYAPPKGKSTDRSDQFFCHFL